MRNNRKMIVILSSLTVFFAAASLLLRFDVFARLTGGGQQESEEVVVCAIPMDQVTAVSWIGSEKSFTLEKSADGLWVTPSAPGVTLDQEKALTSVAALCQVVSNRELDGEEDASTFGLEPARCRVEISLSDGRTVRYLLGDLNPYTNRFYFRMEGNDAVYAVGFSVGRGMDYTVLDYVRAPELPDMETERLAYLRLEGEKGTFEAVRNSQQTVGLYRKDMNWFSSGGSHLMALDSRRVDERAAQLDMLSFDGCVSVAPSAEELRNWQLDTPWAFLEVGCYPDLASESVQALILKLRIGAETENGKRYVQTEEGGMVYLMPAQPIHELMGILEEDVRSLMLCPVQIKKVQGVTIQTKDSWREIDLNWNEDGTLSAQENGQELDAGQISAWLEELTSLQAQDRLTGPGGASGEPVYAVIMDCGEAQFRLDFYEGDVAFMIVQSRDEFFRVSAERTIDLFK